LSLKYRGREAVAAFPSRYAEEGLDAIMIRVLGFTPAHRTLVDSQGCSGQVQPVALGVALALLPVRSRESTGPANTKGSLFDPDVGVPAQSGSMFAPGAAQRRDAELGAQPMDF
jgi:hypothetical protein